MRRNELIIGDAFAVLRTRTAGKAALLHAVGNTLDDEADAMDIMVDRKAFNAAYRARENPDHSRWLMGLPTEWASCAPTETPSQLRSQRASLKQ